MCRVCGLVYGLGKWCHQKGGAGRNGEEAARPRLVCPGQRRVVVVVLLIFTCEIDFLPASAPFVITQNSRKGRRRKAWHYRWQKRYCYRGWSTCTTLTVTVSPAKSTPLTGGVSPEQSAYTTLEALGDSRRGKNYDEPRRKWTMCQILLSAAAEAASLLRELLPLVAPSCCSSADSLSLALSHIHIHSFSFARSALSLSISFAHKHTNTKTPNHHRHRKQSKPTTPDAITAVVRRHTTRLRRLLRGELSHERTKRGGENTARRFWTLPSLAQRYQSRVARCARTVFMKF